MIYISGSLKRYCPFIYSAALSSALYGIFANHGGWDDDIGLERSYCSFDWCCGILPAYRYRNTLIFEIGIEYKHPVYGLA